jgi:hypothetical protein
MRQTCKFATQAGSLDIQKTLIDANVQIEKAKAARAVNDQLARTNSGSAPFIQKAAKISPMLILGGVAIIGAVIYFSRGK